MAEETKETVGQVDLSLESEKVRNAAMSMIAIYGIFQTMERTEKDRFKELIDVISKDWEE